MEESIQGKNGISRETQVDVGEVQKSLKGILEQVKNVEERLALIKKTICENEEILSSVANDIKQMSIKLIELQNSGVDISCLGDKYTNWNAELIYQKYKEKLESTKKNSKSKIMDSITKKIKSIPYGLKEIVSDFALLMLIVLLIYCVTMIFIGREDNLAVPVFLILLIIWRGMVNHFKNFREEDKILATNALNSMLTENNIHRTENIIDEIYQSSVALEDKASSTIKSTGKCIFAVALSVVLPFITGIIINGIKLELIEGKTVVQFMFTLNDIIPSGLWIADLLLILSLIHI